jgi:hypothetical protein|tara:strand:- start:2160 stop:3116 length:957 start_codon:yes stop_codon:yes gene_type:complete
MKTNDLKFPQGCKRIAVCMYGQYRTGDYLLPYYKEFFKNNYNVEVDFFCSVKLTRSYMNSDVELNNKTANIDTVWNKDTLHSKLENNILKPKSVNVILPEQEVLLERYGQLFHGLADSIKLKLTYEIENNFIYDLVFICRYDVLTHPMDLIDYIIPWYNELTIEDYSKIFPGNKLSNFLVGDYRTSGGGVIDSYTGINDLFIWGSSQTADLIMFEIMRLLQQCMNKDNNTITAHDMISDQLDGHNGLSIMLRRSNIGFSRIKPIIKNNWLYFVHRWGMDEHIRVTVVREFFDLTLDPTYVSTWDNHSKAWANDHHGGM